MSDTSASPTPVLCCSPLFCPPLLSGPIEAGDAEELASVLKALADPVRLRLVNIVAAAPDGEACACDFAEPLGKSQPTISHHLTQLVKAGILDREQRGKWAWFRLNQSRLTQLRAVLGCGDCC